MRRLAAGILMLAACGVAGTALAQEGAYAGMNIVSIGYSKDNFPSADPTAVVFKLGRTLHPNLAVEARAGFGVGKDTVTYLGTPVDVELDHYFGVYGKAILPIAEGLAVYGLLGLIGAKVTAKGFGYSSSNSDTSASFGIGADLPLGRHWALSLEWAELFKESDAKVEAASLGLTYRY